jgi:O-antigen/teichoic acid export membrane protein
VNVFFWNRVALLALNRPVYPTIVNFVGMVIKVTATIIFVPQYGFLVFAGLLSGYYIFTVSLAAIKVNKDVRQKLLQENLQ